LKLSLVCPCYNEGDNVEKFYDTCEKVFGPVINDAEFIFINDGSFDNTLEKLNIILAKAKYVVKIVNFSRNFGKEAAMYAGLQYADGDYTCIIDTDLQQRPETVLQMVSILDNNADYDCVAAYQENRKEHKLVVKCKNMFYKLINQMCDVDFKSGASDFRTFRKPVRNAILSCKESYRFMKGIFSWVGFKTHYMPYEVSERNAGETSWSFQKLVKYALGGITAFTAFPLQISTIIGVVCLLLSLLYLIVVVLQKFIIGIAIPGYAVVVVLMLLIGGIQLICFGALGSYLAKVYFQGKNRPIFIVKEYKTSEKETDDNYHGHI